MFISLYILIMHHVSSPSEGVVMSYLLYFCQETWSPAHSLALKPEQTHKRQTGRRRSDSMTDVQSNGSDGGGSTMTDRDSASSGVWSPAADQSAWPGAPASGRRYLGPHWPPAAPASPHPWLSPLTTCTQVLAAQWPGCLHNSAELRHRTVLGY